MILYEKETEIIIMKFEEIILKKKSFLESVCFSYRIMDLHNMDIEPLYNSYHIGCRSNKQCSGTREREREKKKVEYNFRCGRNN